MLNYLIMFVFTYENNPWTRKKLERLYMRPFIVSYWVEGPDQKHARPRIESLSLL